MARQNPETEIGGGRGSFQSTLWSVVLRAKDPNSPERRAALHKLIESYWKPLYFFVRRKGNSTEASKDLTQGFFTELLTKDYLKSVESSRGKFRTFLLTALEHHLADQYDRHRAQKRGGGQPLLSLDFEQAEAEVANSAPDAPDRAFKRDWAVHVMAQAMEAVQSSFAHSGRQSEFEAFKAHLTSTRPEGASYEDLAGALGISVEDVRNRIRTARGRYREAILEVIRSYSRTEEETREELRELLSAFS